MLLRIASQHQYFVGETTRKGRQTRVELRTVLRRGKSAIPASRMEIEESRRVRDDRKEVTDALSEAADEDWFAILAVLVWSQEVVGLVVASEGTRQMFGDRVSRANGL